MTRQYFFSAQEHLTFSDSLLKCLDILESYSNDHAVLGVIFFIDSKSDDDYFNRSKSIRNALDQRKLDLPCNVQAQSCNSIVSIEIWTDDSAEKIEYLSVHETRYTRVTAAMGKSIWGIGITSHTADSALADQIEFAFITVQQILEKEGMTLADIVRQWNYIPDILKMRNLEGKNLQNYQVFNEIRQKYYASCSFMDGYPAATGIGTRNGNYNLDFYAVKSSLQVQKVGLSNPKQQNAYEYQQTFLVGDTLSGQSKKTPLFERAKLLKSDDTIIFISGTASIIGQETIGIGDVHSQTEVTISNMQELIPMLNELQKTEYTYLRAYIKELKDFQTVRTICESHFPNVSVSYLQADVCRENLLVEIEGAILIGS